MTDRGQATAAWLLAGLLFLAASVTAEAQITFRAASSAGVTPVVNFRGAGIVASAASGNVTPGLPSLWQPNDIHILIVEQKDNVVSTVPAGWTLLNAANSGATHRASLWWRRAVAGDTNPLVTHSGGDSIIARIIGFSGVDTTTAFDVTNSFTVSAADLTTEAAGITTVTEYAMLVFTAHMADNHTSIGLPTPGTWTQAFFNATPSGTDSSIAAHYSNLKSPPGAYAAVAATRAGAANAISHGAQLALRPAPVPLTITKPTGTIENDVMIASIAVRPSTVTITAPAGWTLVRRMNNASATANSLAIYRKEAGANEPASYAWTFSPAAMAAGGIQSFSGVNPTTPIDVEAGQNTASGTSHATPSVTTTVANTMLVTSHGVANQDTWLPPTGMTEAFDVFGGPEAIEGNYVLQPAAGSTGSKSATSATADAGNAHILALRPYPSCAAVSEAGYVAATAQSAQVTVYWSSANPVIILRKQDAALSAGEAPTSGNRYIADSQPWGTGAALPYVLYDGINAMAGVTCTATSCTDTGRTNGTTYYYKVFPKSSTALCYATGTGAEVGSTPQAGPQPAWSYTLAGGSMLKAGIAGEGTLHTSSNASRIISLNTADGTQTWAPVATNQPIQSWLTWLPEPAGTGWYNASWTARKRIRIDKTKVGSGGVTDFPLLISLIDTDLKTKAQASGNDILFTSSDGTTKLSHEIERYTSSTGQLIAWVKVPNITSTADTDLYMYYGNAGAANQQNATAVWSNGYVGVWHLKEDPAGAAPQITDSTVNAGHGTSQNMTLADLVAGKIGGALQFRSDATPPGSVVDTGDRAVMQLSTYSWSMWLKADWAPTCPSPPVGNEQPLWNADVQFNFSWGHTGCGFMQAAAHAETGTNTWRSAKIQTTLYGGTWYHIAATYGSGNLKVYLNGVLEQTTAHGAPATGAGSFAIGNGVGFTRFAGALDEARVGSVVRSDAWMQTEYNNQSSPATFYSVGAENAASAVIAGDQSGRVYSVDVGTWTANWTKNLTVEPSGSADFFQATPAAQVRAYANAAFQAAYTDDVFFAGSRNQGATNCGSSTTNNKVFALRASDGTVLWTLNGTCAVGQEMDWIVGMPYVDYARNRLYVTTRAGGGGQTSLWVIDTLNGALVTPPSPLTLGHLEASPTLKGDGSTLYVGNLAGTIYAVDATTLAVKWNLPLGAAAAVKGFMWEDYNNAGRLYFSTGNDVRCVQDNGASGIACAGWTVSPITGASTLLLLDKIYVGSQDGKLHQIVPTGVNAGVDEKQFPAATTLDGTRVGDVSTETGNEVFVGTEGGRLFKIPLPLP